VSTAPKETPNEAENSIDEEQKELILEVLKLDMNNY
jgi:hypothetical protein